MSMNARYARVIPLPDRRRMPPRSRLLAGIAAVLIGTFAGPALAQPGPGDSGAPDGAYGDGDRGPAENCEPNVGPGAGPEAPPATPGPATSPAPLPPTAPSGPGAPPPAAVPRWHLLASIGLLQSWAMGDRSFGLRERLGPNGIEFDDGFGFDIVLGATTPNEMFELGLRIAVAFGALNRSAWEDELGRSLGASQQFLVGPTVRATLPLAGRFRPYAGVDWLYQSIGTSTGESDGQVCDDFGCSDVSVDRFFVRYEGFAFAYSVGARWALGGEPWPWRLFLAIEGRYVQGNWSSLESGLGDATTPLATGLDALRLDHAQVAVVIGGML
ncbi:MAG: hypothetical protein RIT45_3857 [Pseudomonadota bacterium]